MAPSESHRHAATLWPLHLCAERARSAAKGEQREPVVRCSVKFDAGFILAAVMIVPYCMTSSARLSRDGGIVRPSALAVLALITSSNFVGCSTGRSAGFAPFRILSTNVALRRKRSRKLGP